MPPGQSLAALQDASDWAPPAQRSTVCRRAIRSTDVGASAEPAKTGKLLKMDATVAAKLKNGGMPFPSGENDLTKEGEGMRIGCPVPATASTGVAMRSRR